MFPDDLENKDITEGNTSDFTYINSCRSRRTLIHLKLPFRTNVTISSNIKEFFSFLSSNIPYPTARYGV